MRQRESGRLLCLIENENGSRKMAKSAKRRNAALAQARRPPASWLYRESIEAIGHETGYRGISALCGGENDGESGSQWRNGALMKISGCCSEETVKEA